MIYPSKHLYRPTVLSIEEHTMYFTLSQCFHLPTISLVLLCLLSSTIAHGLDTFDGNYLSIPSVTVGSESYSNVVVTVDNIINVSGGVAKTDFDIYNSGTKQLSIPSVMVGQIFNNVTIIVDKIVGVAGGRSATSYDIYNPENNQLSIPSVKVGSILYNNATITVGNVLRVSGGGATNSSDNYNPANNQLTIPRVFAARWGE